MLKTIEETVIKDKTKNSPGWKNIALFLIGWIGLQIVATIIQTIILFSSNIPTGEIANFVFGDTVTKAIYDVLSKSWVDITVNSIAYLIIAVAMSLILNKDWKTLLESFKKGSPFVAGIIGYFLIIVFNNVYNNLIGPFYQISDNINEETLDSIIVIYPVISLIVFGLIGPLCEELTYRVGLYGLIKRKNKVLGYILTIIIFGFIHFSFQTILVFMNTGNSSLLINELLNMPTYMFAAAVFIYLYDNYGLAGSLSAHVINNLISIVTQIILSRL